jgi:hypothetical protein
MWIDHLLRGAAAIGAIVAGLSTAAAADMVAVIAIPTHPDVPVIINGRDASYALVVGDWGLSRPGAVPVTVYGPPAFLPPEERGYYPSTGRRPRYGRQEIERPPRKLPPAPVYRRSWSAGSGPEPATIAPSYSVPEVALLPPTRRQPR